MAMMAKMRSLAPTFIISVGVIFVLFMIISDSNIMEVFGFKTQNIGSIDGEKISYQEFMKNMDTYREYLKQQNGGKDISEDESDQFRDQVWDELVSQKLADHQMKKMGITVSDQEVRNVILSDNPPDMLKKSFIDSTGHFNKQLYLQAIYDKRNAPQMVQAEAEIKRSLMSQKLLSMLYASISVSENEIKSKFIEQSTKVNLQYILASLNNFPDAGIKISDDDIKDYYNKHLADYEVKASRKLKYVMFATIPSAEDSSNVRMNLENIMSQSKNDTTSFKTLVETFSQLPYSKDTLSIQNLPLDASEKIMNAQPGTVVGPFPSYQGFMLYRVDGSVKGKTPIVKASHILINQFGDDKKNLEEAMKIYKQLQNGADFATLAKQYSKDPGSGAKGGDLGWFGKGQMVPEFEKAAFEGKVGVIQKPIKSNYGYHIIKVTGKSDEMYVLEKLVLPVKASAATKDQVLNNAKDFSYIANKDGFEREAKLMNYKISETPPFYKEANFVPGIGMSKGLIDFSFDNGVNSISDAIRTQTGYVVAEVSDVVKEGVKSLDEVKNQIKPLVIKEKKYELAGKEMENIKSKINGDLSRAPSIDSKLLLNQTGEFTVNASIPGIGMDYSISSKALELNINQVSNPIKGINGYYLIKVLSRTPFDASAFAIQHNTIRDNLLQAKKSNFVNEWITELKKDSKIVDNRAQFFGQ
jgi:parvulin-like peptidyl-prolyl isomerase